MNIVKISKVILSVAIAAAAAFSAEVIKVGATPEPHASILNLVKEDLAKAGYELNVVEFTDYVTPNEALESGELDANYFQHLPYLESFNKEKGTHLVNAGGIHVEPFALYPSKDSKKKVKSLKDLKKGGTIAIPNDPTNEGRALLLLQSAGLIKLDPKAGITATPIDIVDNPKKLKFKELEAASLPRILQDVDAAAINGNYAIPAGLNASTHGLFVENASSPYVNVVAVKAGNEKSAKIQALVNALKSEKVKNWIKGKYPKGEVVPVF